MCFYGGVQLWLVFWVGESEGEKEGYTSFILAAERYFAISP